MLASLLLVTLLAAGAPAEAARPPLHPADLIDLWNLAKPHLWRVFQESSHDRTGGNDDGFSGRFAGADAAAEQVLFDQQGPGCVFRIWSANPGAETRLEFFLDGETEPRLSCAFADLFSGRVPPFVPPLAEAVSGGSISYVPIPFARSLMIVARGPVRFYQITWGRFAEVTPVSTYAPDPDRAAEADALAALASCRPAPPPGAAVPLRARKSWIDADGRPIQTFAPIRFPLTLLPGQSLRVEAAGPAALTELRIEAQGDNPAYPRRTLVRIWFDGAPEPAVEAPLCDFFGTGFPGKAVESLPLSARDGAYACRFVMPFARSLRLEIRNADPRSTLQADAALAGVEGDVATFGGLRFHARFRREVTAAGRHVDLLDAKGSGHYVGCVLTMKGPRGVTYLEGDEQALADGGTPEEYHGTGTEDYFNAGWYFSGGAFCRPLHGLTHQSLPDGEISTYRFHVSDAIPYASSLLFRIEHGGRNDEQGVEYSSVTYWYAHPEDAHGFTALRDFDLEPPRRVLGYDREALHVRAMEPLGEARLLPLEALSRTECGPRYAVLDAEERRAEFSFPVAVADRFQAFLLHASGPGAGRVAIALGDAPPFDVPLDGGSFAPLVETPLGVVRLLPPASRLALEYLGDSGRGLVEGLRLEPALSFVTEYEVCGPFPLGEGAAFREALPPERGEAANWAPARARADGYLDLCACVEPREQVVAYGRFRVDSPTARAVTLRLGSDDWVAVFVNGTEVHRHVIHRGAAPDQDLVPLPLRAGRNEILLKVANEDGGFGLCARISDPEGGLTFP
ncbi:MAG: DUF2961 domain-containing protein [Planctomycetes bacterium]|nr:DUF2961 domain-containing protein [Planctomycetota bacterium]